MGKYITRVLKYFVFLMVLVTLVIVLLVMFGYAEATSINTIFKNGYNAVWQIALIFFAVALIYPKLGFGTRNFTMRAKSWDEARMNMFIAMGDRGYKLESEDGKVFKFRKKWFLNKLMKFLEDRITIEVISDAPLQDGAQAPGAETAEVAPTEAGGEPERLNKYEISVEGLTKDILRIVSTLYRVQSQNKDE